MSEGLGADENARPGNALLVQRCLENEAFLYGNVWELYEEWSSKRLKEFK